LTPPTCTENQLRETYAPRIPATYILDTEGRAIARINENKAWDEPEGLTMLKFLIPNW
jgi:hypothetical protein